MMAALKRHWQAYNNACPQYFELAAASFAELNIERMLMFESMNIPLRPGWEHEFHGATVVSGGEVNAMVDRSGNRVLLVASFE